MIQKLVMLSYLELITFVQCWAAVTVHTFTIVWLFKIFHCSILMLLNINAFLTQNSMVGLLDPTNYHALEYSTEITGMAE